MAKVEAFVSRHETICSTCSAQPDKAVGWKDLPIKLMRLSAQRHHLYIGSCQ